MNPISVLILDGFSNHNWPLNTRLLRSLLNQFGGFAVSVSTCPVGAASESWSPDFSGVDVIIQTCNDINQNLKPTWPAHVKEAFTKFIRDGGGAFIFHSANNAFPDWDDYNRIIGIGWRPVSFGTALQMNAAGEITRLAPGEGSGTSHAPRAEVLVHNLGDHPIHADFPEKWRSPLLEVYSHARGPAENLTVLSYGQDPKHGHCWPLEWTVTFGHGRAYSSSFGHVWRDESETAQPVNLLAIDEQILIHRALQWLANRPITVPVPSNFPTEERVSLSAPIPLT